MNSKYSKYLSVFFEPTSQSALSFDEDRLTMGDKVVAKLVNDIPRFVLSDSYAESFGWQWNTFRRTQLDSSSGTNVSRERLVRCLGNSLDSLREKKVLEAGCGAGRFTEHLVSYASCVHAFDLSNAIDANSANNGSSSNLVLAQADIMNLPFKKDDYHIVLCLGVLQHTPCPDASVRSLWSMVKRGGGVLCIDHYHWNWRISAPWPLGEALPLYRWYLRKISAENRMRLVKKWVDFWFPVFWRIKDSNLALKILRRVSPLIFHYPSIVLPSRDHYYEWAFLDTHDATTDYFKHRRTEGEIQRLLESLPGVSTVETYVRGNGVEARAFKL